MTGAVTSKDGTSIAFTEAGSGPSLVLVDGAFCCRDFGPARDVAERLAGRFRQHGGPLPDELAQVLRAIASPTRVLIGGKSPPYLWHAVARVAETIPSASVTELPGQQHDVSPKAVAPILESFLSRREAAA